VDVSDDTAAGTLTNRASVSTTTKDPTPGNDSAPTTTTVQVDADLQAHKTAPNEVYIEGRILYELSVTNHGPSQATAVILTDDLPVGAIFQSASPGCKHAGGTVTCDVGALAPGTTSATYNIEVTLDQGLADGTVLQNSVTASASSPDSNGGNDTATDKTTVTTDASNLQADLELSKTAPDTIHAGGTMNYTLQVRNRGALDASGVTLTDDLPPEVDFDSATPSQGTCSYNSGNHRVTCDLGGLVNGASATVAIAVTVPPQHVDQVLTNEASVSANENDWNQDNDSDSAPTTVTPSADLSVAKSGPATVNAGEQLSYQITVRNDGPNYADDVTLTDTLPSDVTFVSATTSQGTCSYDSGNHRLTCDLGTLANGTSAEVTIVVAVPSTLAAGSRLTNSASVSSSAHEDNPGDETASADTTVQVEADLALSKSDTPDPVLAGRQLSYQLTVTNNGPSQASGVVLSDNLPDQVAFVPAQSDPRCSDSGGLVTCHLDTLARGGSRTVTIVVNVPHTVAMGAVLQNNASVSSGTDDPTTPNNATADTTVQVDADLEAHKSATDEVYIKGRITYELSVTNHGPSQATGVRLTDDLPNSTFFADASPGCTHNSGTVTCNVGTLAVGETSDTYTITVTLDQSLADGAVLQNRVTASGSSGDSNGGNDSASASTTVTHDPTNLHKPTSG